MPTPTGPEPDTEYEQPRNEPSLPWQEQLAKTMRDQAEATDEEDE